MNHLENEFFTELVYSTIQKDAVWREYEEEMQDFSLFAEIDRIDRQLLSGDSVFLCGYLPQLDMEMAILALYEEERGYFYCRGRQEGSTLREESFALSDRQEDFAQNMLLYAAATQILQREDERAYHKLARQYAQSKSPCSGCSGCNPR